MSSLSSRSKARVAELDGLTGQVVHLIVVVAELRGLVDKPGPDLFMSFEVVLQGLQEIIHRNPLLVEDQLLHRGQGIGHVGYTDLIDGRAEIVAGAAVLQVLAHGDAVIREG